MGRESRSTDAIALCGALLMVANMVWPTIPQYVGIPLLVFLAFLLVVRLIWTDGRAEASAGELAANIFPDVRAATCEAVQELMSGDDRRKMVGLLQAGTLTAWSYVKGARD